MTVDNDKTEPATMNAAVEEQLNSKTSYSVPENKSTTPEGSAIGSKGLKEQIDRKDDLKLMENSTDRYKPD